MKKTLLVFVLVLALCLPCFAGCETVEPEVTETGKPSGDVVENDTSKDSSGQDETKKENENYDEMFNDPYEVYEKLANSGYTGTFEEWVASLAGKDGADGKDGEDGKDGADGMSAYELAVEKGYEGTVEEWLISLVGAPRADQAVR